jgi:HAD superfamily phosphatase
VDDAISAKEAGVPFIGVAAPSNPRYSELVARLKEQGAFAVVNNVNELHGLMEQTQVESA